jgi:hypothetical protein
MTVAIPVLYLELCEGCREKTDLDQLTPGTCLNKQMLGVITDMLCEECKKQLN